MVSGHGSVDGDRAPSDPLRLRVDLSCAWPADELGQTEGADSCLQSATDSAHAVTTAGT